MFPNLVTYHIHRSPPLPTNDALAYQYILAGNGVFIRAETHLLTVCLPVAACAVRGLARLETTFQLRVPRFPASLLDRVLADARRARRPDGELNEVLYQFHHHSHMVQIKKPRQRTTCTTVTAAADNDPTILCDLHSHGNMAAFFSPTDNADEQGIRLYGVMGRLDTTPELRLRVGVYGYWLPLPVTAVFTHTGSFQDVHQETQQT